MLRIFTFLAVLMMADQAAARCLLFAADLSSPLQKRISTNLRIALGDVGLCFRVQDLKARQKLEQLRLGLVDGDVARIPSFKEVIGAEAFMLEPPVLIGKGLLVSQEPAKEGIKSVADQKIGISFGVEWQNQVTASLPHVFPMSSPSILKFYFNESLINSLLIEDNAYNLIKDDLAPHHVMVLGTRPVHVFMHRTEGDLFRKVSTAIHAHIEAGNSFLD